MSKKFTLNQLTEGIRQRHVGTQNRRLIEKWARTGLLRGLEGTTRENMATLLENQAAQVLREANSISTGGGNLTSSGDLRGFTNIAFPIVRRVFGGLIANELVSIQPMSLPSGLLFYLDYTYGTAQGGASGQGAIYNTGSSIYNAPAGKGIRSGSLGVGGQYDLVGSGYSRVYNTIAFSTGGDENLEYIVASGAFGNNASLTAGGSAFATGSDAQLLQFDPQILDSITANKNGATSAPGNTVGNGVYSFAMLRASILSGADYTLAKEVALFQRDVSDAPIMNGMASPIGNDTNGALIQDGLKVLNVRRLNQLGSYSTSTGLFTADPLINTADRNAVILLVLSGTNLGGTPSLYTCGFPLSPSLNSPAGGADGTLVIPAFESNFAATPSPEIPEIDIKIESIAVTAVTRKLRARWSPELAQDLNAYHSLDAEVELTQILSEQVALELDREILNDLLTQAKTNYHWSRMPGKFVNKKTGASQSRGSSLDPGPAFTGTVREWYETLIETVIDVANEIHRLTLRGSANFMVVSPDVATILEASVLYRPKYTLDGDGQVGAPMSLGAEAVGTLSNRFTVYKDPYFPRNKVLVGYKGGSYLETGYVYAPYVPLIVTPTIFAPEDFTPRKGVMTRYGKKMVRSDFYGTVTVQDLNVI
jgi:hypothetical protein